MKRFKIAIETSTSCVGTCTGCALTSAQRQSQVPVLNELNNFFSGLQNYYNQVCYYNDKIGNGFDHVVVELVVGEHFNFSDDYLLHLCSHLKIFLDGTGKKYIVAISTSGLLLRDKTEEKVKLIASVFNKENLEIHLICDLNKMEKYKVKYDDVLDLFKKYFSFTNLLVNFDNQLKLSNCDLLSELLKKYEITDFQLVYGLKQHNIDRVGYSDQLFYDVYTRILKGSSTGFRQNDIYNEMKKYLTKIKNDEQSIKELLSETVDKWTDEQVFINHDGEIFNFISTMLGGVELDERAGFDKITSIYSSDAFDSYLKYKKHLQSVLLKTYIKHEQCQNCPIQKECYSVGIPLLAKGLFKDGQCYSPLLSFYNHASELIAQYDAEVLKDFQAK